MVQSIIGVAVVPLCMLLAGCTGQAKSFAKTEPQGKAQPVTEAAEPELYRVAKAIVQAVTEKSEPGLRAATAADTVFVISSAPGEGGLPRSRKSDHADFARNALGTLGPKTCLLSVWTYAAVPPDANQAVSRGMKAGASARWTDYEDKHQYLDLSITFIREDNGTWLVRKVESSYLSDVNK
jgi:hypothetical protein